STVAPVAKPLNAGAKLTLTGPSSASKDLPFSASTGYSAYVAQEVTGVPAALLPLITAVPGVPPVPGGLPANYITPGQWSIAGTGGSDIGAFTAPITVPTLFNCTN